MTSPKANLGASVAARILNRARERGDDYQNLLTSYCFERLLYRLGTSPLRARFVLKGAMLLRTWSEHPYRATRDLDFLRRGEGTPDAIRDDLSAICATPVVPDGVSFDVGAARIDSIRAEDEHVGTRATLTARCGTARLPLQIDMGIGDAVWPAPVRCTYPGLLDFPAPDVLGYPREAVIAEKLEAMVVLGDRNSRIKDFFDLHHLATHFAFDRATLVEAVRRTFARRHTIVLSEPPIGLTDAFWRNPSRPAQVTAFARRARLSVPADPGRDLGDLLRAFLLPVLEDVAGGVRGTGTWRAGGPWVAAAE